MSIYVTPLSSILSNNFKEIIIEILFSLERLQAFLETLGNVFCLFK